MIFSALIAAIILLISAPAWAQPELRSGTKGSKPAANPTSTAVDSNTNALDVNVVQGGSPTPATAACKTVVVNVQGVAGADVTVDNTAGGVSVLAASATRCGATIKNTGTAAMRCSPSGQTPSTTVGQLLNAGDVYVLGLEGQQAWNCIRTTGSSTSAGVSEATP